jgi:hypothetical protein
MLRLPLEEMEGSEESPEAVVRLTWANDQKLQVILAEIGPSAWTSSHGDLADVPSVIFVPGREVLSIYPGFIAAYLNRESSFDETYFDLCVALNASLLRPAKYEAVKHLNVPFNQVLGGEDRVTLVNDRFYIELSDAGKLEAPLVAEGYRKIATFVHLIRNGSLTPESVLLWDEPESGLNPRLVTAVVEFLVNLANAGAQIFLATHDYLLSHELSLRAEYDRNANIKFFSLYREEGQDGVLVEPGESLAEIQNNPILEEYVAHHDRENELFYASVPEVAG